MGIRERLSRGPVQWLRNAAEAVGVAVFVKGLVALVVAALTALLGFAEDLPAAVVVVLALAAAFLVVAIMTAVTVRRSHLMRQGGELDQSTPPSKRPAATPEELAQPLIKDRSVRLCDLVDDTGAVRNKVFLRCDIRGPGVVVVIGQVQHFNTTFGYDGDNPEAILWPWPATDRGVGVIGITGCEFRACTTFNLGFTGSPDALADLRAALGIPTPKQRTRRPKR